ncbi:MAG TPA: hypothetical protein VF519_02400 [Mycobacteriales bacterium]|jgi:hypothetical protein
MTRLLIAGLAGLVSFGGSTLAAPPRAAGTLTGSIPLCYGPGPDLNLRPESVVEVRRGGEVVATGTFRSDEAVHTYRFDVPPGEYAVRVRGLPDTAATAGPGETTYADLTAPPCL